MMSFIGSEMSPYGRDQHKRHAVGAGQAGVDCAPVGLVRV